MRDNMTWFDWFALGFGFLAAVVWLWASRAPRIYLTSKPGKLLIFAARVIREFSPNGVRTGAEFDHGDQAG
jgi:hypothetical protein